MVGTACVKKTCDTAAISTSFDSNAECEAY